MTGDCESFQAGSCAVPTGDGTTTEGGGLVLSPCPPRYVCFTCLSQYLPQQFAGCLDGLFDRIWTFV